MKPNKKNPFLNNCSNFLTIAAFAVLVVSEFSQVLPAVIKRKKERLLENLGLWYHKTTNTPEYQMRNLVTLSKTDQEVAQSYLNISKKNLHPEYLIGSYRECIINKKEGAAVVILEEIPKEFLPEAFTIAIRNNSSVICDHIIKNSPQVLKDTESVDFLAAALRYKANNILTLLLEQPEMVEHLQNRDSATKLLKTCMRNGLNEGCEILLDKGIQVSPQLVTFLQRPDFMDSTFKPELKEKITAMSQYVQLEDRLLNKPDSGVAIIRYKR